MIIGPENSENSKLVGLLENTAARYQNIGNIVYRDETIQVPSSYMRSPFMIKHLITTQQKAFCILMLLNAKYEYKYRVYSSNIAKAFRVSRIGVISVDTKNENQNVKNITKCEEELINAGVDEIYFLDIDNNECCKDFIKKIKLVERKMSDEYSKI
ncbi:hypothetical protein OBG91_05170 [Lactococcus lactis]|nr:hypothetical protein [Lactococcus lactis]